MRVAWLSAPAFARVAGISRQGGRNALSRACEGQPWRGHHIDVRRVRGRGGCGGWVYRVRADSLPEALQQRAATELSDDTAMTPAETRPSIESDASAGPPALPAPSEASALQARAEAAAPPAPAPSATLPVSHDFGSLHSVQAFRLGVIAAILRYCKGSSGRERAIAQAAREMRDWPSGRRAPVGERTIRRWLSRYGERGEVALLPRRRADRGRRRVYVSRSFDKVVVPALGAETVVEEIVKPLESHRRSLWQEIPKGGERAVTLALNRKLRELTAAAGFDGIPAELRALCKVGRAFVLSERREDQAVAIYRKDPREWHTNHRHRIRRSVDGLRPMDLIVCDWHHLDIEVHRADGSVCTPKMIAWQDVATGRVFYTIVFLPKGESVRQEHIAESFLAMLAEPGWGLPRCILRDNGPEYNLLALVADAMKLGMEVRLADEEPESTAIAALQRRVLLTQIPYNAQSKRIEGLFGNLERGVLALMPGQIGGNRLNKRGAHAGKKPTPYPRSREHFQREFRALIRVYESTPQQGSLRDRSPAQVFAEFVNAGWKWQPADVAAFRHAFARDETRTVHRGQSKVGGDAFTADKIKELPNGTKVRVRIPILGIGDEIPVTREGNDMLLCMAQRKPFYDHFDGEGARETARSLRVARDAIARRRRLAHPVDPVKGMVAVAADSEPAPVAESRAAIDAGGLLEEIARTSERPPAERHAIEAARAERRREKARHAQDAFLATRGEPEAHRAASDESGGMSNNQRLAIDALLQRRRAHG